MKVIRAILFFFLLFIEGAGVCLDWEGKCHVVEMSRGLQSGISHGGVWKSLVGMCKTKAWSIGRKMGEGRRWGRGEDSRGETRLQGKAMAALR